MGIYSYGISGSRILDEIGVVSTIRFRFSRSHMDRQRVAHQEKLDEQYEARWAGKSFSRLIASGDQLRVWAGTDSPICDDFEPRSSFPLTWHSFGKLSVDEQMSLPMWVLGAMSAVEEGELPFVPTTKKAYYEMVDKACTKRLIDAGWLNAQPLLTK